MEFETLEAPTPNAVWEALRAHVKPGREREVPVAEAIGSVLTEDARAAHDYPQADRAAADGYAVRVTDFEEGQARLRSVGLARADSGTLAPLKPGTCVQTNSGAAIPPGADAIVAADKAQDGGEGFVQFKETVGAGQYINRRASLVKADELLVRAGTRITAGTLATLLASGLTHVTVFAPPQVAQLTSADKLAEPGRDLEDGQIRDSNTIVLDELIRQAGGETVMFGRRPSDPIELRASLELGLSNDLLCITGGASPGTHDPVPALLEELGVRWLAKAVRLKPTESLCIGRSETGCWVMGLPGNPVGCAVCFLLFGRELLGGLQGLPLGRPGHVAGYLEADLPANDELPTYQPAEWSAGSNGDVRASPLVWRGPGDPFGMATANALIYRAGNAPAAARGETIQFIPLDLPR